jgi:hypothetical protein
MTQLRYPQELPDDFFTITAHEYSSRIRGGSGGSGSRAGAPIGHIILPMPDLPNLLSTQQYGEIRGAARNLLASGLGIFYDQGDRALTAGSTAGLNTGDIANQVTELTQGAKGPVLREIAAGAMGAMVNLSATQFQAMATGEVTNPQVELLYKGPQLRSFTLNFTMAPKNSTEAESVFEIIKFLKQNHLPKGPGRDQPGMLKIPKIFKCKAVVQGKDHYQHYFEAVLEGMSVKQNSAGTHITLPGGEPVVTQMSLAFKEIFVTTADDFESNI